MNRLLAFVTICFALMTIAIPGMAYIPSSVSYLYEYTSVGGGWFQAQDLEGIGAPTWQTNESIRIPDVFAPASTRTVWFEATFFENPPTQSDYFPDLVPSDWGDGGLQGSIRVNGNVLTVRYDLSLRPHSETIYCYGYNGRQGQDFYYLRGISSLRIGAIVPEPDSLLMILGGAGSIGMLLIRKRR
jgi:hypothetical protein